MTINRACRQNGPTGSADESPVAQRTSGSTASGHDDGALGRLDAIEAHLDEMLIQLDQIRANLTPLLDEFAPAKPEGQDSRND